MKRLVVLLMPILMLLAVGCATSGATTSSGASDGGGLPEIAAVDDAALEALPDVIAAE